MATKVKRVKKDPYPRENFEILAATVYVFLVAVVSYRNFATSEESSDVGGMILAGLVFVAGLVLGFICLLMFLSETVGWIKRNKWGPVWSAWTAAGVAILALIAMIVLILVSANAGFWSDAVSQHEQVGRFSTPLLVRYGWHTIRVDSEYVWSPNGEGQWTGYDLYMFRRTDGKGSGCYLYGDKIFGYRHHTWQELLDEQCTNWAGNSLFDQ